MNKKEVTQLFNAFSKMRVMIIGDVMIDSYCIGNVERISPEAPVPVVAVIKKENRLGGAANVALNIQALGAEPLLCTVTGKDEGAATFLSLLKEKNMRSDGVLPFSTRSTTVKTRIIGGKHQMLRIDEETDKPLSKSENKLLFQSIVGILRREKVDVIIFEDYDKGSINSELIKLVVSEAKRLKIPVAVDPKRRNFMSYVGVNLFKPNLKELLNGLKIDFESRDFTKLFKLIKDFKKKQKIDIALITLSEHGMLVSSKSSEKIIPAHLRSIADVSGAGDTVISVAALCLAAGAHSDTLLELSNLAGGLVCEKAGVVPIEREQLMKEALK